MRPSKGVFLMSLCLSFQPTCCLFVEEKVAAVANIHPFSVSFCRLSVLWNIFSYFVATSPFAKTRSKGLSIQQKSYLFRQIFCHLSPMCFTIM